MIQGSLSLLNMASNSALAISAIFSPLGDGLHIHSTFDASDQRIHIELPRLKLDFDSVAGCALIYSRQYRGFVVDSNQALGTLVGLSSRLILRHEQDPDNRLLLVPEGTFRYARNTDLHLTIVTVFKGTARKVNAHSIDQTSQRLIDTGNLNCNLTLAYLHAITSSHLSDPLTGRTGTEAALELLAPASVLSFGPFTSANTELLIKLAKLPPERYFYPSYLKEMQSILWDADLPSFSQHGLFSILVQKIFDQAERTKVFYQNGDFQSPSEEQLSWLSCGKLIFPSSYQSFQVLIINSQRAEYPYRSVT